MEKLIQQFIESIKKNRRGFKLFKNVVVTCQQFELAATLRDMEKEVFPSTEEETEAKESASKISTVLGMVGLNVSDDVCWLISETLKVYKEKQGEFSIEDAAELTIRKQSIFITE